MAAGATYEPIATQTLSTAASSITFSSIAATYTDLRLVIVPTVSSAAQALRIRLNGDTATNYSETFVDGDGAAAASYLSSSTTFMNLDAATSGNSTTIPTLYTVDFLSYAGSTYKTALVTNSGDRNGSGTVVAQVDLWRSTSAITTILAYVATGNLSIGTTATLYGIKAA